MPTNTLAKITAKAKTLRKADPKMKWTDAIKKASKQISGVKVPAKKSPAIAGKPKNKRIAAAPAKITSARPKKKISAVGKVAQGEVIMGEIGRLEKVRKAKKTKYERDFYARAINGLHDKLDAIHKKRKKA